MLIIMKKKLEEILERSNKRRANKEAAYIAEHKTKKSTRSKMKLGTLGKDNIV